jgi:hypothetical protein
LSANHSTVLPRIVIDKAILPQLPIIKSIEATYLYVLNASSGRTNELNLLKEKSINTDGRIVIDLSRLRDGEAIYVYQEAGDKVEFMYNGASILHIDKKTEGDNIINPTYDATRLDPSIEIVRPTAINPYTEYIHKDFTFSVGSTIIKKNKTNVSPGPQKYFNGTDNSKYYKSHTLGGIGRSQNRAIQRHRNRKT